MKLKIKVAHSSFKGNRKVNQDYIAHSYNKNGDFLAIVCDGVGSVEGSEHASKLIAEMFAVSFKQTNSIKNPKGWVDETLKRALFELKIVAGKIHKLGIATTMALVILANNKYYAFNIGDTRIYTFIYDKDEIVVCSRDHNYRNYLISKGYKGGALEEYRSKWHALTNFIDASHPSLAKYHYETGTLKGKTWFVISTDGVWSHVSRFTGYDIFTRKMPVWWMSRKLNKTALKNNSDDNVSNIAIKLEQ